MIRKLVTTLFIGYLISMYISTHVPTASVAPAVDAIGDKRVHLLSFAILEFLLILTLWLWNQPRSNAQRLAWGLLAGAAYAIFDETTQPFFGRSFEWMDLNSDLVGLALGGCLAMFAIPYLTRPKEIKPIP